MMQSQIKQIAKKYHYLYQKLYDREPRGFRVLSEEFVIVNDMQIRLSDFEQLTRQLEEEYRSKQQSQKSVITRLIKWFKQT